MGIASYYKDSATVKRYTESQASDGSVIKTLVTVATIKCFFLIQDGRMLYQNGLTEKTADAVLFCKKTVDLRNGDMVLNNYNGKLYKVDFVEPPQKSLKRKMNFLRAMLLYNSEATK